jgi:hypothetical protein
MGVPAVADAAFSVSLRLTFSDVGQHPPTAAPNRLALKHNIFADMNNPHFSDETNRMGNGFHLPGPRFGAINLPF